jgi:hypothetical protein
MSHPPAEGRWDTCLPYRVVGEKTIEVQNASPLAAGSARCFDRSAGTRETAGESVGTIFGFGRGEKLVNSHETGKIEHEVFRAPTNPRLAVADGAGYPSNSRGAELMKILYLADRRDTIPQLAEWFYAEWASLHPGETKDDVRTAIEQ